MAWFLSAARGNYWDLQQRLPSPDPAKESGFVVFILERTCFDVAPLCGCCATSKPGKQGSCAETSVDQWQNTSLNLLIMRQLRKRI